MWNDGNTNLKMVLYTFFFSCFSLPLSWFFNSNLNAFRLLPLQNSFTLTVSNNQAITGIFKLKMCHRGKRMNTLMSYCALILSKFSGSNPVVKIPLFFLSCCALLPGNYYSFFIESIQMNSVLHKSWNPYSYCSRSSWLTHHTKEAMWSKNLS